MIFRTPFFLPWIYPQLVWRVKTSQKIIYLTFDDGPVPDQTVFVLETLKAFDAKATFFCIGDNVKKHPHIFKQLTASHAIGNHTFNHLKGWSCSKDQYMDNIMLCDQEFSLNMAAPTHRKLFRPPYGRIRRNQIQALHAYQIVMWDVLTHDYAASCSPERCLQGSIQATRPGSIVVFHDSVKADRNMKYALPRYLQHFKEQGYSFEML